ncbi:EamA family transporter [Archaeoglobales archaeon]|nr:MAG: EamA family transporter [Archaeoglobales archaeon]
MQECITKRTYRIYADIGLLFIALIWGLTFPVIKIALDNLSPFAFNTIRFTISSLLFLPILKILHTKFDVDALKDGLKIGFFVFLGYTFQTVGLDYTTATNAGFITSVYVVLTPIIAFLIYKTPFGLRDIISTLLAFAGLFLLSGYNGFNIGDVLILVCAIAFATEIAMISHYSKLNNPTMLAFMQILVVAVFSFPISLFTTSKFNINHDVINALIITAIFATVIAKFMQNWLQKYTMPSDAAVIFSMEGVFSHIFAILMLNEVLSFNQYVGAALVVLGVIIVSLR